MFACVELEEGNGVEVEAPTGGVVEVLSDVVEGSTLGATLSVPEPMGTAVPVPKNSVRVPV